MWDSAPLLPAVIAFSLAIHTISTAGFFVAVLSGKKIISKIVHNIAIIIGTCAVTYGIGLDALVFLGIDVVH
jgi:VIT1/CCC1 family predicted Fe2+/Mn2+ transporter